MAVLVSYYEHTKHLTLLHQIFMIAQSEIVTQVVCFEVVLKFFGSELKGMWRIENGYVNALGTEMPYFRKDEKVGPSYG